MRTQPAYEFLLNGLLTVALVHVLPFQTDKDKTMATTSRPSLHVRESSPSPHSHDIPEGVLLDGPVDPQAVNMIADLTSPSIPELNEGETGSTLPWWKRPSPAWLLYGTLIGAMAMSSTIAPRVEVYIKLACQEIRPEYNSHPLLSPDGERGGVIGWPSYIGTVTVPRPSAKCQADPEVQAAVASLGATITTIMGILSALTAGWWGRVCPFHYQSKSFH